METIKYYYSKPIIGVSTVAIGQDWYVRHHSKKRYPRMVICSILDRENGILNIGWSIWSGKEKFVKERGKQLAYERARNAPNKTIKISDDFSAADSFWIRFEIFNEFYEKTLGSLAGRQIW